MIKPFARNVSFLSVISAMFVFSCSSVALAESNKDVEIERLKTELAACKQVVENRQGVVAEVGDAKEVAGLKFAFDGISISKGDKVVRATVNVKLINNTSRPMILLYQNTSFVMTDNFGYRYNLGVGYEEGHVKGLPVFKERGVDSSGVLAPGEERPIVITAKREMKPGESVGDTFNISATFVEFKDLGEGKMQRLRTYPYYLKNNKVSSASLGKVGGSIIDALFK